MLEGSKNGTDLLYHHAKYGGDHGSRAGCKRKSVMFFCLSISVVSLHRGSFVVVHLCSSFPIDPQNFSGGANFYQKLPFLAIFGALQPNF